MRIAIALLLLGVASSLTIAEPVTGPVIGDYGPVYYLPEESLDLGSGAALRAVFDIAAAPEQPGARNHRLETVARYLNMHARAGLEPQQMHTAVVLHGRATRAALNEEVFEERYGEPNPDADLLRLLAAAGVRLIVCGQSATAFGFRRDELAPDIEMSLSALTALIMLQTEGFALIPWGQ